MDQNDQVKYKLASGTRVRKENFGLLFYTMNGSRLYFLASGKILGDHYFQGEKTLKGWIADHPELGPMDQPRLAGSSQALARLSVKGVLLAC